MSGCTPTRHEANRAPTFDPALRASDADGVHLPEGSPSPRGGGGQRSGQGEQRDPERLGQRGDLHEARVRALQAVEGTSEARVIVVAGGGLLRADRRGGERQSKLVRATSSRAAGFPAAAMPATCVPWA